MMRLILFFVLCAVVYSKTEQRLPSKLLFEKVIKCIAEVKEHRGLSQQKSESECNEFFRLVDKNSDDCLDKKELTGFLKLINLYRSLQDKILTEKWKTFFTDGKLTKSELVDDLFTADENGDGVLQETEVDHIWKNHDGYADTLGRGK